MTLWVGFPLRRVVLGPFQGGNDTAGGFPTASLGTGIVRGRKRHSGWDSRHIFRHWGGSGEETTWRVGFPPRRCVLGSFRDTYLFPLPPHSMVNFCAQSPGPGQWLWLAQNPGWAKGHLRPKFWPGLAQLLLARLGLASGLRPELAHHYIGCS
jgi:hypothetical protein